jgi:hypothetical protein
MPPESVLAGIVFPSSLFEEEWMWYLGAFVAFNTIVFVGLSIGKFIPWPPQASTTTLDERRNRAERVALSKDLARDRQDIPPPGPTAPA